jgi:hypothetical protein
MWKIVLQNGTINLIAYSSLHFPMREHVSSKVNETEQEHTAYMSPCKLQDAGFEAFAPVFARYINHVAAASLKAMERSQLHQKP